ncbi:hypothetical protein F4779DRAFT_621832 [Xylariaceae sp. FL0662B]|nr:hypothetical protein F4779DRAFT_621832 [Xylariaceae sp. FL0662B]
MESRPQTVSARVLSSLFNHIALPARLPQRSDANIDEVEIAIVDRLLAAAKLMRDAQGGTCWHIWDRIRQSLLLCKTLNVRGRLESSQLVLQLKQLQDSGLVILHVATQNAGITIHKPAEPELSGNILFEFFEASPKREDVLASQTLSWAFPGTAILLPCSVFYDDAFLENLAAFLEQASVESTKKSSEYVAKAGHKVAENRESSDPSLITSFLTAVLEANGKRISPKQLQKRVRDDVCWFDSESPWRRLPYWLVLRVAIARYLAMTLGGSHGRIQYKFLMCVTQGIVLNDTQQIISLEDQAFLKAKLCRRLCKLDQDRLEQPQAIQESYDILIDGLTPQLNQAIEATSARINEAWLQEIQSTSKEIPLLPRRARPEEQRLSLIISRQYLQNARGRFRSLWSLRAPRTHTSSHQPKLQVQSFGNKLLNLFDKETKLRDALRQPVPTYGDLSAHCSYLHDTILCYINQVDSCYNNNPEQKSIMLLTLMEAWVALDRAACTLFPLLLDFHPIFSPYLMEILQLSLLSDIDRARTIEEYLQKRIQRSGGSHSTLFNDPGKGCFAERYFNESANSSALDTLLNEIQLVAAQDRDRKEQEWKVLSAQYESLSKQIDASTCVYVQRLDGGSWHDARSCQKCQMERERSRIKIRVFESPLPEAVVMAKTVVFELMCPKALAAYRDATWAILYRVSTEIQEEGIEPKLCIQDYSELQQFSETSGSITLASTAKSFLMTHWSTKSFPVDLDQVCLPNGLRLAYFDQATQSWPGRKKIRPTFAHHCRLTLPTSSSLSSLLGTPSFEAYGNGPSSYEIMASQYSCPAGLNVHEYMAFQFLSSGKRRRWVNILTELGSSNLNLSTETTVMLLSHLALQIGRSEVGEQRLGTIHCVFRDNSFCNVLLQQVTRKLEGIASNWRETHLMELIIMLTLRLITFASPFEDMSRITKMALDLLSRAREITLQWVKMLRMETYRTDDLKTVQSCQSYLLWAALLCKRTCASHLMTTHRFEAHELSIFLECSATVYNNIPDNPETLEQIVKNSFIRDLRMVHDLKDQVRQSIERYEASVVLVALQSLWPASQSKSIRGMVFDANDWLQIELDDNNGGELQVASYNYIFGILLIDGEPLGRLPTDPESTIILEELFGSQISLMKYPSKMPGMSYVLTFKKEEYETHIGYDNDGAMIIRAVRGVHVLELVPRKVFRRRNLFDLPAALVDDCIHWLNTTTGIIEIRPKSKNIWRSHRNNWRLDLNTSICSRITPNLGMRETLVDPYSSLFIRASKIFEWFELPSHLTIYQPNSSYSLTVDMKRMQLRWFVNANNRLQSAHLRAEIDPNQSVGTWYGFDSKLVCRSLKDPTDRFILVPLGGIKATKRGSHVQAYVEPSNASSAYYIRYVINKTLGRIDCEAEPTLVYRKAEIHALTSFILPDPLTGLTGTESAVRILASGVAQPWAPLGSFPIQILQAISRLSPRREYYPEDKKVMKKELWSHEIPTTIQRDEFRNLVERILSQSTRLSSFYPQETALLTLALSGEAHLSARALYRRQLYQRQDGNGLGPNAPSDLPYEARDILRTTSLRYANVLETVSLIRNRPTRMATVKDLATNLSQSLTIKGYAQSFEKITLSDRLGVDVRQEWGSLVNSVKETRSQYSLMFFIGVISFRSDANMPLIRTLIAFAHWEILQTLTAPIHTEYCNFRPGQTPQLHALVKLIEPFKTPPPEDPPLMQFASARDQRKLWLARVAHNKNADEDCTRLAQSIIEEWPIPSPSAKNVSGSYLVDIPASLEEIRPEWERLYQNHEFYLHLEAVQKILNQRNSDTPFQMPEFVASEDTFFVRQSDYKLPTLENELVRIPIRKKAATTAGVSHSTGVKPIQSRGPSRNVAVDDATKELEQIVGSFLGSKSAVRQRYAADLKESLTVFKSHIPQPTSFAGFPPAGGDAIARLQETIQTQLFSIQYAMEQGVSFSRRQVKWLKTGGLWPAVTPVTVLEQLRSKSKRYFGTGMKENIIQFALSITKLQQQTRMESYQRSRENARFEEERRNVGHLNWSVEDYPDWLLLEIESNILIRETQVEVALAIIAPESGQSSVLQLNMGQGKTSCIIPMVAVMLADSKNLVRVSVPKALLQQTAQLLHGRLGGLIGRELGHVPFSRRTSTKEDHIKLFQRIHHDIKRKRGVMICLPEHQMSFKLSGLQRVLDQRIPEANMMVRVQEWLKACARDVLDESDHTLAVKTQLIYPSGSQMSVDGHPHRWLMAEQILHLVDMHLYDLALGFPHSIEVVRRPQGGFPFVFFLRPDVEEELIRRLTFDVCRGTRGIIPVDTLDQADRLAIKEFLSGGKVRQSSLDRIGRLCPDRPHIRQCVYLLRGLFVHRILIMTLKKRYGVQYGLHPLRDPVAVPFHAKGVPSEQSEFGHVDVAILLTALAFYYCGINLTQTRQALEAVLKSDDPTSEYDKWVEDEGFPDYLKDWHSINVDDSQQMTQIWNCVRYKVAVIDYYINNFVFPPHAKQFKIRLQSSGWDIPLFSSSREDGLVKSSLRDRAKGLTTGFSGTNDIKPLLPLTIKQDDLPSLSHTNAEVLIYLLQHRSRKYVVMADSTQRRLTEEDFLHLLRRCNIRVLIDAGAQILEQSNLELAQNWLKVDGRATVALYFQDDKPYIVSKQGARTPLLASPYADNLREVLVYLDEAHTRGTDLKFGADARAALTLGLGQTKDHTVQAAMRLRQLGTTQSVVFFAPPEVNQSIRDLRSKKFDETVDSSDVIHWLINNTCDGIEQLQPLYYSQGIDFCNRMQAAENFPNFLVDDEHRAAFVNAIRQTERQTLHQLYGPQTKAKNKALVKSNPKIASFVRKLDARKKAFQDTGQAVHASALQEVEQERQTENEVEAVRQVKKPLSYTPYSFPGLHKDLDIFAKTGRIPAGSDVFVHVLKALARTTLGRKYKVNREISTSQLFVSAEFERTVKLVIESTNDNFLRPVQWLLYSSLPEAAVIVTPEEAESLIEIMRETEREGLARPTYLLTYAAPVTRRMMHFNDLKYYTIPPVPDDWVPPEWLKTELGFFAGRLYFDWSEYGNICSLLGVDMFAPMMENESSETESTDQRTTSAVESCTEATSDPSTTLDATKAIIPTRLQTHTAGLTPKPYTFTQEYLAVRRRGQDFSHTPMGFVCTGKPLNHDHPFFRRAETTQRGKGLAPVATAQVDGVDEDAAEDMMDLGHYDPSAAVLDNEDQVSIEYDESEMYHQGDEDESDESDDVEAQPVRTKSGRRNRPGNRRGK